MFGIEIDFWGFILGLFPWWVWGLIALGVLMLIGQYFLEEKTTIILEKVTSIAEQSFLAVVLPPLKTLGRFLRKPWVLFPLIALGIGTSMYDSYQANAPQRFDDAFNALAKVAYSMALPDQGCLVTVIPFSDGAAEIYSARIISTNKKMQNRYNIDIYRQNKGFLTKVGINKEENLFTLKFAETDQNKWNVKGEGYARKRAHALLKQIETQECNESQISQEQEKVSTIEKQNPEKDLVENETTSEVLQDPDNPEEPEDNKWHRIKKWLPFRE